MLPLGGLFLGIGLIPLFPPLRAVMLKKEGGEQCRLIQPVNRCSGYRLRPYWVTWIRTTQASTLLVFEFTQVS